MLLNTVGAPQYTSPGACVVLVSQSCPTLRLHGPSPPGSSVHRILQARILEWIVIPFLRASSRPRDRTQVSGTAGRILLSEALEVSLLTEASQNLE